MTDTDMVGTLAFGTSHAFAQQWVILPGHLQGVSFSVFGFCESGNAQLSRGRVSLGICPRLKSLLQSTFRLYFISDLEMARV